MRQYISHYEKGERRKAKTLSEPMLLILRFQIHAMRRVLTFSFLLSPFSLRSVACRRVDKLQSTSQTRALSEPFRQLAWISAG